jgi:hypothetical protein
MPERIQLRRSEGWRKPPGAVVVARPSRWGNPFVYRHSTRGLIRFGPEHLARFGREWDYEGRISAAGASHDIWFSDDDVVNTYVRWATRAELVELYRLTLTDPTPGMLAAYPSRKGRFAKVTVDDIRRELAGKDLACWCPLVDDHGNSMPCHADTLLAIARGETPAAP